MVIDAFAVLRHGIYSVFRNIYPAFLISWPWLAVFGLIYGAAFYFILQSGFGTAPLEPEKGIGTFLLWLLLGLAVYLVGFASIAVNWHRYILLDEVPRGTRRLRVDQHVRSYLWRLLKVSLMVFFTILIPVVAVVFFYLPSMVGSDLTAEALEGSQSWSTRLVAALATVVLGAFAGALFFRWGLCLPAAALGRFEITTAESTRRTQGNFKQLILLAGGSTLLQVVAQFVLDGLAYPAAATEFFSVGFSLLIALNVVVTWFFTFLGITLLTSLYGHLVEQRPL